MVIGHRNNRNHNKKNKQKNHRLSVPQRMEQVIYLCDAPVNVAFIALGGRAPDG